MPLGARPSRANHACDGSHGPTFTTGSPSRAFAARFAILRRPARPASRLPTLLHHNLPPKQVAGGEAVYNRELYLSHIRLARSAFGASFYVIPAGNVTAQRGVPARCRPEQVAELKPRLSRLPRGERTRILAAQARYLAYLRYLALHAEGICASVVASEPYDAPYQSGFPSTILQEPRRRQTSLPHTAIGEATRDGGTGRRWEPGRPPGSFSPVTHRRGTSTRASAYSPRWAVRRASSGAVCHHSKPGRLRASGTLRPESHAAAVWNGRSALRFRRWDAAR
jgi:hypothetical protein